MMQTCVFAIDMVDVDFFNSILDRPENLTNFSTEKYSFTNWGRIGHPEFLDAPRFVPIDSDTLSTRTRQNIPHLLHLEPIQ